MLIICAKRLTQVDSLNFQNTHSTGEGTEAQEGREYYSQPACKW